MIKLFDPQLAARLARRFDILYGPAAVSACMARLHMLAGRYGIGYGLAPAGRPWSQRDAWGVAYGDQVSASGEKPLQTLKQFADRHFTGALSGLHLLPFFPFSSDDGFSVVHYREVQAALGGWRDITALGENFDLMFDLVLNHASRESGWFRDFTLGIAPAKRFFIAMDPRADLSQVTRPRTSPLLTRFWTRHGEAHLWTTFSADQVDLNFACPDVLFEFLDLLLFYIAHGARMIRLDAIAYLWKKPGTPCVHLPETHEVVKLVRDFLEGTAPGVRLLTETNVPDAENRSYFGNGDEAHLIYQFTLPPLLLHALRRGTAQHLAGWLRNLPPAPTGCSWLNFTASHDGIGVRPLEKILPDTEIARLAEEVRALGGRVSARRMPDGNEKPYELNSTYYAAVCPPGGDAELHLQAFICSQTVPMSLQGIPLFYFNSLVAGPNDLAGVAASGQARRINRQKWDREQLDMRLRDPADHAGPVLRECLRRLRIRAQHPAFHPDGRQEVLELDPRVLGVWRTAPDNSEQILCLHNVSGEPVTLAKLPLPDAHRDLLAEASDNGAILQPFQCRWLARSP